MPMADYSTLVRFLRSGFSRQEMMCTQFNEFSEQNQIADEWCFCGYVDMFVG